MHRLQVKWLRACNFTYARSELAVSDELIGNRAGLIAKPVPEERPRPVIAIIGDDECFPSQSRLVLVPRARRSRLSFRPRAPRGNAMRMQFTASCATHGWVWRTRKRPYQGNTNPEGMAHRDERCTSTLDPAALRLAIAE